MLIRISGNLNIIMSSFMVQEFNCTVHCDGPANEMIYKICDSGESTEARIAPVAGASVRKWHRGSYLYRSHRTATGRRQQRGESSSTRGERTERASTESETASRHFRKLLDL